MHWVGRYDDRPYMQTTGEETTAVTTLDALHVLSFLSLICAKQWYLTVIGSGSGLIGAELELLVLMA